MRLISLTPPYTTRVRAVQVRAALIDRPVMPGDFADQVAKLGTQHSDAMSGSSSITFPVGLPREMAS